MSEQSAPLMGRTALVTGGARRVGAAVAGALHRAGATLVLHHHTSTDDVARTARSLERDGRPAETVRADLASPPQIAAMFDALDTRGVLPDIVVNSASNFLVSSADRPELDVWNASIDVNLRAPYLIAMHAARRWAAGDLERADIVNVTDVWGERPAKGRTAYCVSKAGLIMLTRSLARELGPRVRVNAVSPGPVLMPEGSTRAERDRAISRTVMRRMGSPEDVAEAVLFLVARTGFATGSIVTVDGGRSIV